ncbi:hypothetical protein NL676_016131 [Syzygium grande]|nr:hypothetical protein NL676_016131 [Syzygium grande]
MEGAQGEMGSSGTGGANVESSSVESRRRSSTTSWSRKSSRKSSSVEPRRRTSGSSQSDGNQGHASNRDPCDDDHSQVRTYPPPHLQDDNYSPNFNLPVTWQLPRKNFDASPNGCAVM